MYWIELKQTVEFVCVEWEEVDSCGEGDGIVPEFSEEGADVIESSFFPAFFYHFDELIFLEDQIILHDKVYDVVFCLALSFLDSDVCEFFFDFVGEWFSWDSFDEAREFKGGDLCLFDPLHFFGL